MIDKNWQDLFVNALHKEAYKNYENDATHRKIMKASRISHRNIFSSQM